MTTSVGRNGYHTSGVDQEAAHPTGSSCCGLRKYHSLVATYTIGYIALSRRKRKHPDSKKRCPLFKSAESVSSFLNRAMSNPLQQSQDRITPCLGASASTCRVASRISCSGAGCLLLPPSIEWFV